VSVGAGVDWDCGAIVAFCNSAGTGTVEELPIAEMLIMLTTSQRLIGIKRTSIR
jgi:hypothetical protein